MACCLASALLTLPVSLHSQKAPLYFTPIPYSDPDIISPGRGAEQWENGSESVNHPLPDTLYRSLDVYNRFPWTRIEDSVAGQYNWEYFDGLVKEAIDNGQKLSFGIMPVYDGNGTVFYDGAKSAYPLYLHKLMQSGAENTRDWVSHGVWIPNWNHAQYIGRLKALHIALNNHILTTSYKGIPFKNVIYCIDIRGYGNFGEWHNSGIVDHVNDYPPGRMATAATLKNIINIHTTVFKDWPLTLMIAAFDAGQYDAIMTPPEVTYHALTTRNTWGPLGWRRDQWGATDAYLDKILKNNEITYDNSVPFGELIKYRYLTSPVTGEPPRYINPGGPCDYWDLERQLIEYGATSIGNGNWGKVLTGCGAENARAAFKRAGYRIILESGSINGNISIGKLFEIELNWRNIGIAPTYENWDVIFELKNDSNKVVWSQVSVFKPKLFVPSEQATTIVDRVRLPDKVAPGEYYLQLVIRDPSGYRKPLPLAIKGRNEDGSYTLKKVTVSPATCVPPTATLTLLNSCNEQPAMLKLEHATGAAPFDLVINNSEFKNITPGQSIVLPRVQEQRIWTDAPSVTSNIDAPVELGLRFKTLVDGTINGIRFFSPEEISGKYTGHLWDANGRLIGGVEFDSVTPLKWHEVYFKQPVPVKADSVYVVSYHSSSGHYASTPAGLKNAIASGSVYVTGESMDGASGVYSYGNSPSFPVSSYNASNYWADFIFIPKNTTYQLSSITDAKGCNRTGNLQEILFDITDSCDKPVDTIPDSISALLEAAKICKGDFHLVLKSANGTGPFDLVINGKQYTGILPGDTIIRVSDPVESILENLPSPNSYIDAPVELGMKFTTSKPGKIKGIRFFSPADPTGTYTGHLWTSDGKLIDSVVFENVLPDSWNEGWFKTPVNVVAGSTYVISYHCNGHYASTPEGLKTPISTASLYVPADSLTSINGLYAYGPSGSFPTYSYRSSNYWVDVLYSVDSLYEYNFKLTKVVDSKGAVNEGLIHALTVKTSTNCEAIPGGDAPSAQIKYLPDCSNQAIHLVLDSADGTAPFDLVINGVLYKDIMPGQTITSIKPPALSVWNHIPPVESAEDQPVTLGVKFKSAINGYIKGIRFFSPANATGSYTGHLWSKYGQLLDSAVFTNVTASGWQETLFSQPVYIQADSVYIASYFTSAGRYSATSGGLKESFKNGNLTVLSDSEDGGNGVFRYGSTGLFPDMTYNAHNYWVDVLFTYDTSFEYTFELTAITDKTGATRSGSLQSLSVPLEGCNQEKPVAQSVANNHNNMIVQMNSTHVDEVPGYSLDQNRPNPFTSQTIIGYSLPKRTGVNLSLYDAYGRLVKTLVSGWKDAGYHTTSLDKGMLGSGIYFYKLQTHHFSAVKKLIIQ